MHISNWEGIKMLGDLIYEAAGKVVGMRVLDDNGTMEITLDEQGKVFGIECSLTLTAAGKLRPNGMQYSEGRGFLITKDGDLATLIMSGISIPKGRPPSSSVRGATIFNTQSPKLARLNSVVCVYEGEVNEDNSYTIKDWEWK
jgi:uncharacterized protein YuzE